MPLMPVYSFRSALPAAAILLVLLAALSPVPARGVHALAIRSTLDRIAFSSDRTGNQEIWLMDSDGSHQTQLTFSSGPDLTPTFSPNGMKIAFATRRQGDDDIWIMNADGTDPQNCTATPGVSDDRPTWSPDGTKIAYHSNKGGNTDIYYIGYVDGQGCVGPEVRLTNDPERDVDADWSPAGTQIVFVSYRIQRRTQDIWVMNPDGTNQRDLDSGDSVFTPDHTPTWSADGSEIVFHSHRTDICIIECKPDVTRLPAFPPGDLFVMRADGSNVRRLTEDRDFTDEYPAVSPDGTKIAWQTNRGGAKEDIYVMNYNGSNMVRLTSSAGFDSNPAWSPQPQLLWNSSFELDSDANGIPDDWAGLDLTTGDERTDSFKKTGKVSFTIIGSPATTKSLVQLLAAPGTAGQRFLLRAFSKARGATGGGQYRVRAILRYADGTRGTFQTDFAPGTHGWQRRQVVFTAAKDFTGIEVFVDLWNQSGQVWFDSVQLHALTR